MTDERTDELDDLEQLIALPGWQRFVAMLEKQDARFDTLVEDATLLAGERALTELRSIVAIRKDRRQIIAWPRERIRQLKVPEPDRPAGAAARRGRL